jgi:hypothetical protein
MQPIVIMNVLTNLKENITCRKKKKKKLMLWLYNFSTCLVHLDRKTYLERYGTHCVNTCVLLYFYLVNNFYLSCNWFYNEKHS